MNNTLFGCKHTSVLGDKVFLYTHSYSTFIENRYTLGAKTYQLHSNWFYDCFYLKRYLITFANKNYLITFVNKNYSDLIVI